jgi:hypothetical protein
MEPRVSFGIVFTQSALTAGEDDLSSLEERAREEIAELPGEGLSALEQRLFHAFATETGREYICVLTGNGAVRVDACLIEQI